MLQVMAGDPVEINPSVGSGYRVMSVAEWAARFKCSQEFPECLACGGSNTKEHAFTQVGVCCVLLQSLAKRGTPLGLWTCIRT